MPACAFFEQDIIFANAALQWVGDHQSLLPRLMRQLTQGGVLAVQMPNDREEPSHRGMREVASQAKWSDRIGVTAHDRMGILGVDDYYNLLAPQARIVDIWQTCYYHVMPSLGAIADWMSPTALRPFLAPLVASEKDDFIQDYLRAIGPGLSTAG